MKTIILSGNREEGKTQFILALSMKLKQAGISIGGFAAPRLIENSKTVGYQILNLNNGVTRSLLTKTEISDAEKIGPFYWCHPGKEYGQQILKESCLTSQVIFIDELGRAELADLAWHRDLLYLQENFRGVLVLSIRNAFVDDFLRKYQWKEFKRFSISNASIQLVLNQILLNS